MLTKGRRQAHGLRPGARDGRRPRCRRTSGAVEDTISPTREPAARPPRAPSSARSSTWRRRCWRGTRPTRASDLWALGCVLYEMATAQEGVRGPQPGLAHLGHHVGASPRRPRPLAPLTPPALEQLIQRLPRQGPGGAHPDRARREARAGLDRAGQLARRRARCDGGARRGRERLAWALAGVLALVAAALGSLLLLRRATSRPQVVRFEVRPPRGTTGVNWPRLSPDGRTLAFLAADSSGTQRLWVRPLDAVEAHPLEVEVGERAGRSGRRTAGGWRSSPTASCARSRSPAGRPCTVCDAPGGYDGTWGRRGWILFDGGATDSIRGVPASGGTVRAFTLLDRARGETGHSWPFFLPDGRHFLFVASRAGSPDAIRIGRWTRGENREVGHIASRAEYAHGARLLRERGHARGPARSTLRRARLAGDPGPVGDVTGRDRRLVLGLERRRHRPTGRARPRGQPACSGCAATASVLGEAAPPGGYQDVVLSPDGTRAALGIVSGPANELRPLGPRPRPRCQLAPDLRARRRARAGLVAGRRPHRLRRVPRRRAALLRPLGLGGRRRGLAGPHAGLLRGPVRLVARGERHHHLAHQRAEPVGPVRVVARGPRAAAAAPGRPVQRGGRPLLPRRTVAGLRLERVGAR